MHTAGDGEEKRFARMMAEGAARLGTQAVLACIPMLYSEDRLYNLWQNVRALSGIACRQLDIIVMTDPLAPLQRQALATLLAPLHDRITIREQHDLTDPMMLVWRHKSIIAEEFLAEHSDYDLFAFLEDDLILTPANLAYFLAARETLRPFGMIPSFVRFEFNRAQRRLFAVDQVRTQTLIPAHVFTVGQVSFAHLHYDFCAIYMLDRELAAQHVQSVSFDEERSRCWDFLGVLERASLGQMLDDVPAGAYSRSAVAIRLADHQVRAACLVHHAADKYTNVDGGDHGRITLSEIFAPE